MYIVTYLQYDTEIRRFQPNKLALPPWKFEVYLSFFMESKYATITLNNYCVTQQSSWRHYICSDKVKGTATMISTHKQKSMVKTGTIYLPEFTSLYESLLNRNRLSGWLHQRWESHGEANPSLTSRLVTSHGQLIKTSRNYTLSTLILF